MTHIFTIKAGPTLMTSLILVTTVWLGLWQLERLEWKQDILSHMAEQQSRPAQRLPQQIDDPPMLEYGTYEVSGSFAHDLELYLFATGPNGSAGYHIYTPLIRLDGSPVLINRGWVPVRARNPETRTEGQIVGQVNVRGIARLSRLPGPFTPENNLATNNWYYADLTALAEAVGLPSLAGVILDADDHSNPGGLPLGGVTRLNIPNNHLAYALTWFIFGLIAAVVYVIYSLSRVNPDPSAKPNSVK